MTAAHVRRVFDSEQAAFARSLEDVPAEVAGVVGGGGWG